MIRSVERREVTKDKGISHLVVMPKLVSIALTTWWALLACSFDNMTRGLVQQVKAVVSLLRGKALKHRWDAKAILEENGQDNSSESSMPIEDKSFIWLISSTLLETTVPQFDAGSNQLNNFLPCFPTIKQEDGLLKEYAILIADQLCNIVNLLKKPKWTQMMMEASIDPYNLNLQALPHYLERVELINNLHEKVRQVEDASRKCWKDSEHKKNDEEETKDYRFWTKKPWTCCGTCRKFPPGKCLFKNMKGKSNNQVRPTKTNNQRMHTIIDGCSTRCKVLVINQKSESCKVSRKV
jgi:hypothetical protein